MRRGIAIFLSVLFCFLSLAELSAQSRNSSPFSNLRYKTIAIDQDTVRLDSLSIAMNSLIIDDVADSAYLFFPTQSLLVWRTRPKADSIHLRYRVLPLAFHHSYNHKSPQLIDSDFVSLIYAPQEHLPGQFVDFNQIEYNGSYGRSISLGNNQDVVLNSQFNLQASGYILDSVKLEAAITDNTIPFQPEGNTQRLQEFDQVYIRLSENRHLLQLGDYNIETPPVYFLKFFKRVQGAYYQTAFDLGRRTTNSLGVSGSVAKGQFARNIFQGQEGNQGPYKLTGNNGEQFFIVLAATERVFVDNVLMERGENADYIINYNTAEVRFMPRRMITKDSRIQVEFEYQDRNYLNSLIYAWDELKLGDKLIVRVDAYSNQDAKNQPLLQNLTGDQKRFLSTIGDSVHNAFYPSIATDTFGADKILYKMVDTIVGGIYYDSVFVYSAHPDSARYALAFSYVGANKGNYIISSTNANGRVYDWVAPVNGIPQGSYAPVQLLIAPRKQQVFIVNTNYKIDSLKNLNVEVGASNVDPNLFSDRDNQNHWGMATKLSYTELRRFGPKDSVARQKWKLQNAVTYEYVQDKFTAIAPYRNVEFGRDWNVPLLGPKPDEHLFYASTRLSDQRSTASYNFSYYQRGSVYTGFRSILGYEYNFGRVKTGVLGNMLKAVDTSQRSVFYRPSIFAEYQLSKALDLYIGGKYDLEHNELRSRRTDTLLPQAFSFDIITAFLRTSEVRPTRWSLSYFTRRDRVPFHNNFAAQNHSHNVDVKLGFYQWKNHQLNLTGTFRKLVVDDTTLSNLQPEETMLGRVDYTGSFFKNAISLNTLYEFGSGQEQKRSYTFVEVPAGQGVYTWNDYNGDGVQQANEFEVAIYQDQKRFIRVFTPTNEYVKVNYVNYNFSIAIEPSWFWEGKERKRWQKLVSRLSSQTQLQIGNRLLASEGLRAYNPFIDVLRDESIILTNNALSNSLYFNRTDARWGLDYNQLFNTGKQLLVYGVEGSRQQQHLYKLRWNVTRPLTINLTAKHGDRAYQSALEDSRTYRVINWSGEPSLTWLHRSVLRITGSLRYEHRENEVRYGGELATIQSLNLEVRFSKPATGVVQLRGTYSKIDYNGVPTAPVSFVILDALQNGSNYLWYLNWERRVGKGIELSLEYEGRKPGIGNVIHTGRMSVRAIL